MAQIQQIGSCEAKFLREMLGRGSLGEAAQDLNPGSRGPMGSLKKGTRPGVEDTATGASVFHQGGVVFRMNRESVGWLAATRTLEAAGMKQVRQKREAFFLVQEILNRENHHGASFRLSEDS
jgi:hypothetical protein